MRPDKSRPFRKKIQVTPNPSAVSAFYQGKLGFVLSDTVVRDDDEANTAIFIRSDPEHHSLACFLAPEFRFDHYSLETTGRREARPTFSPRRYFPRSKTTSYPSPARARIMAAFREDPGDLADRIFVSCGVYEGLIEENRALVPFLRAHGADVLFVEARDGHHWQNWRDQLRVGLAWVFPDAPDAGGCVDRTGDA